MKIKIKKFQVNEKDKVKLKEWPTKVDPLYSSKEEYEDLLIDQIKELGALQQLQYASDRYSLLVIFQAMDAAGKDGAIKHVMSGINPQGCQVFSFKHPSATDLDHDFLWRTNQCLPERGRIGIFNRSYYEEVLVVRVHPEILKAEQLPDQDTDKKSIWKHRYESIVDSEKHLHRNGTRIIKFFLHVSKDEQKRRFLDRIENPEKNWKFSAADIEERKFWDEYQYAYEECLSNTSTDHSPWYVIPADDKLNARLIISEVIINALKELDMQYPVTDDAKKAELATIREQLLVEND
ncbi:MAG: polyphosphate kinase 2 family protein [Gammaproteobacteria bacterium]|nr:MAG: polyphosphate kinase 2 family protein [Gammaproteobacteria bacterium]